MSWAGGFVSFCIVCIAGAPIAKPAASHADRAWRGARNPPRHAGAVRAISKPPAAAAQSVVVSAAWVDEVISGFSVIVVFLAPPVIRATTLREPPAPPIPNPLGRNLCAPVTCVIGRRTQPRCNAARLHIGRCGLWGNPPAKVRKRTEAVSRSVTVRRASKR
jgi:hypothetical protein